MDAIKDGKKSGLFTKRSLAKMAKIRILLEPENQPGPSTSREAQDSEGVLPVAEQSIDDSSSLEDLTSMDYLPIEDEQELQILEDDEDSDVSDFIITDTDEDEDESDPVVEDDSTQTHNAFSKPTLLATAMAYVKINEERLISLVQECRLIWDLSDPKYKDNRLKKAARDEIKDQLNVPEQVTEEYLEEFDEEEEEIDHAGGETSNSGLQFIPNQNIQPSGQTSAGRSRRETDGALLEELVAQEQVTEEYLEEFHEEEEEIDHAGGETSNSGLQAIPNLNIQPSGQTSAGRSRRETDGALLEELVAQEQPSGQTSAGRSRRETDGALLEELVAQEQVTEEYLEEFHEEEEEIDHAGGETSNSRLQAIPNLNIQPSGQTSAGRSRRETDGALLEELVAQEQVTEEYLEEFHEEEEEIDHAGGETSNSGLQAIPNLNIQPSGQTSAGRSRRETDGALLEELVAQEQVTEEYLEEFDEEEEEIDHAGGETSNSGLQAIPNLYIQPSGQTSAGRSRRETDGALLEELVAQEQVTEEYLEEFHEEEEEIDHAGGETSNSGLQFIPNQNIQPSGQTSAGRSRRETDGALLEELVAQEQVSEEYLEEFHEEEEEIDHAGGETSNSGLQAIPNQNIQPSGQTSAGRSRRETDGALLEELVAQEQVTEEYLEEFHEEEEEIDHAGGETSNSGLQFIPNQNIQPSGQTSAGRSRHETDGAHLEELVAQEQVTEEYLEEFDEEEEEIDHAGGETSNSGLQAIPNLNIQPSGQTSAGRSRRETDGALLEELPSGQTSAGRSRRETDGALLEELVAQEQVTEEYLEEFHEEEEEIDHAGGETSNSGLQFIPNQNIQTSGQTSAGRSRRETDGALLEELVAQEQPGQTSAGRSRRETDGALLEELVAQEQVTEEYLEEFDEEEEEIDHAGGKRPSGQTSAGRSRHETDGALLEELVAQEQVTEEYLEEFDEEEEEIDHAGGETSNSGLQAIPNQNIQPSGQTSAGRSRRETDGALLEELVAQEQVTEEYLEEFHEEEEEIDHAGGETSNSGLQFIPNQNIQPSEQTSAGRSRRETDGALLEELVAQEQVIEEYLEEFHEEEEEIDHAGGETSNSGLQAIPNLNIQPSGQTSAGRSRRETDGALLEELVAQEQPSGQTSAGRSRRETDGALLEELVAQEQVSEEYLEEFDEEEEEIDHAGGETSNSGLQAIPNLNIQPSGQTSAGRSRRETDGALLEELVAQEQVSEEYLEEFHEEEEEIDHAGGETSNSGLQAIPNLNIQPSGQTSAGRSRRETDGALLEELVAQEQVTEEYLEEFHEEEEEIDHAGGRPPSGQKSAGRSRRETDGALLEELVAQEQPSGQTSAGRSRRETDGALLEELVAQEQISEEYLEEFHEEEEEIDHAGGETSNSGLQAIPNLNIQPSGQTSAGRSRRETDGALLEELVAQEQVTEEYLEEFHEEEEEIDHAGGRPPSGQTSAGRSRRETDGALLEELVALEKERHAMVAKKSGNYHAMMSLVTLMDMLTRTKLTRWRRSCGLVTAC
ncbi:uncharacterized protein LOC128298368 [Anopheles moucheti]|uniref:uncharacterized protein LOC128298368 n=1 Tax=Anopheles moucheti TaxID=186751 RepID=UPI0022F06563|nr:uncharacterized protein LOC128298368 [Anopheles moucheti]